MIVLPIVNRERILNVEVTLKDVSKVGSKTQDFNINSSDIVIHNKKYNDSFYSKSVATPKSVMSFLRENGKIGKSNILVTTKVDGKGLFDIYDVKYPSDKVSDGLDNLIGTLLLDLKNESSSQKGRYLDLYKLGVFDIITEERLTDLEFLSKNMNQLNIAKYVEEHDLRCLFKLIQAMDMFSFKVINGSVITLDKFDSFTEFLEPTNSKDYNNLLNYSDLAKNNKNEYSKLSYIYKIINNKPLNLIQTTKEKVKVYKDHTEEAS